MHGQFAWYELTSPDTDASKKFYPTFTGWGTEPFDNDYTLFTSGGVPVAGLFHLNEEMRSHGVPPNWMPYIASKNIDETANLATSMGAKVLHGPVDIPGTGRIAVIQDPQGATFGIYKSSAGNPTWDGTPVVGHFSWNELMTSDHAAAFDFYRRLFGWDNVNEMDMGDGLMYRVFGKGSAMYGGMFTTPKDMAGMHPFWLCYINVKNVPASLATATKNGASVHRPPMDIPGGVIAILGDPQGAGFALHHVSDVAPAPKAAAKTASAAKPRKAAAKKKVTAKKKVVAKKKSKTAVKAGKKKKKTASRSVAKSKKSKSAKSAKALKSKSSKAKKSDKKKRKGAKKKK